MKYFFLVSLIVFSNCNTKKDNFGIGQIKVNSVFCKYDIDANRLNYKKFKLFKKGENITEIIIPKNKDSIIHNLEFGEYYIEYKTIFNQKNITEFKISESKCKEIELCYDYLNYQSNKNILLLDELLENDYLTIFFESQGCFHSEKDKMKVTKSKKTLVVEYRGIKYNLTPSQTKTLREFEIELRSNHSDGCSTVDSYSIFNDNESFSMTDGSCLWRGFDNLITLLKLKN